MQDWGKRNQKNKHIVWDFWQRMNHATPEQIPGLIKAKFHRDVDWNGPHPINQILGVDALIADFWTPLLRSFPDLKRDVDILMGGAYEEEDWVSGTGYLTGTFVHDWLGIPATGKETNIHFGQFFVMRDEKIAESYLILDVLAVMKQAGFQVLPPALGREGGKVQRPRGGDGVLLTEQDALESSKTMDLVDAKGSGLMRYQRARDGDAMGSMQQREYWHPFFHWMGPAGIGSTHSIDEFEDLHQRPWLLAFGDRHLDIDRGGRFMGRHADGRYAATGVWDYKFSKHYGAYQGFPSSGKMLTIRDFDWHKREGNLLIQNWIPIDMIDLFRQMGVDLFDRLARQVEARRSGRLWWEGAPAVH